MIDRRWIWAAVLAGLLAGRLWGLYVGRAAGMATGWNSAVDAGCIDIRKPFLVPRPTLPASDDAAGTSPAAS